MEGSMPGFPVHHYLPEFAQTHVHWVGDAIQPSHPVIPFSSCLQSFPASAFPMSRFLASGGQSIGASASASVLPINIQGWFPLGLIGLISLKSQVILETSPASQFFCTQPSLWSNFHIRTTGKTIALTILPGSSVGKESLGWEDPLEKGKATYCSILAWRIPWTVESMGSQRVGHDWATFTDSLTWLWLNFFIVNL